ncbi:MAG: hypothetical protein P8163_14480 [Candidatus Thiodiazotropha sp.]
MDIRKLTLPVILVLTFFSSGFSTPTNAADLKYTYVEGRYFVNIGMDVENGDGFVLSASYKLQYDIFVTGGLAKLEADDSEVESQIISGGLGYIYSLNNNWNADAKLSFVKVENDFPKGKDDDDTGYQIETGVRGLLKPELELQAHITYTDTFLATTALVFSADYYLKPNISAGTSFGIDGDGGSFTLGAKYYF